MDVVEDQPRVNVDAAADDCNAARFVDSRHARDFFRFVEFRQRQFCNVRKGVADFAHHVFFDNQSADDGGIHAVAKLSEDRFRLGQVGVTVSHDVRPFLVSGRDFGCALLTNAVSSVEVRFAHRLNGTALNLPGQAGLIAQDSAVVRSQPPAGHRVLSAGRVEFNKLRKRRQIFNGSRTNAHGNLFHLVVRRNHDLREVSRRVDAHNANGLVADNLFDALRRFRRVHVGGEAGRERVQIFHSFRSRVDGAGHRAALRLSAGVNRGGEVFQKHNRRAGYGSDRGSVVTDFPWFSRTDKNDVVLFRESDDEFNFGQTAQKRDSVWNSLSVSLSLGNRFVNRLERNLTSGRRLLQIFRDGLQSGLLRLNQLYRFAFLNVVDQTVGVNGNAADAVGVVIVVLTECNGCAEQGNSRR